MKIGLEIHVQLPTRSKMFCPCPTTDADAPNFNVCPTCLGMPGSRPVLNRKVLEYGIMLAKLLNCRISDTAWFSRKTYFYPDMSKSVQITQYDNPIGYEGVYMLNGKKPIRITRIHLEEDPGKTKRVGDQSSLVDYNRSGIALAEIVTEPDFSTPAEAREFVKELISDIRHTIDLPGDGERSIRCDCNISMGSERCEIKNVTGLKNIERALMYDAVRQTKLLKSGGKVERETRRFDEEKGVTISVRKKEFEADYGYIDEPDLGIYNVRELARSIAIKESPLNMAMRLHREYGIEESRAKQLVSTSVGLASLFEELTKMMDVKDALSWTSGTINANWRAFEGDPEGLRGILRRFVDGEINDVRCDLEIKAFMTGRSMESFEGGSKDLEALVEKYLDENPDLVSEVQRNEKAVNRIIGFVMKETKGQHSSTEIVDVTNKVLSKLL